MNRLEAYEIISKVLDQYRRVGFDALSSRIGTTTSEEILGPSGVKYTVDVAFAWSAPDRCDLLLRGRIDDLDTFHFDPLEEKIRIKNPKLTQ